MHPRKILVVAFAFLATASCGQAQTPAQSAPAEAGALLVETVAEGLRRPWGLAFLPGGALLVTEREGAVQLIRNGAAQPLAGGPRDVMQSGQSGLQDIAVDPRFAENGFVYVSYMTGAQAQNHLNVFRARFDGAALQDGRVIFSASPRSGTNHPGGRMAFLPDETLLVAVGVPDDQRDNAQSLANHLGTIVRITREGAAPADNPFIRREGAAPEIYSYGHRNVMGIAHDAEMRTIWAHENGPRGGDELNRIVAGGNYGWPIATFGREYSGGVITAQTSAPGAVDPVVQWTPSLAPSGMTLYRGEVFSDWQGDLLIGFLLGTQVRRVHFGADGAPQEAVLLAEDGRRIRDIRTGPDGFVYLLTDAASGQVLRVRPGRLQEGNDAE